MVAKETDLMTLHENLIDGEWVGGEAISDINPSNTDDVVGEYARASAGDAKAAIAAAKAAFPAWSRSGLLERHALLRKTADEIMARKDELGRLLAREEGKTLAEGIGETVRAGQIFDFFAGEALRLTGETVASVRPGVGVEMTREPMGVVGLPPGRSRRLSATATPSCSSRRSWCRAVPGRLSTSSTAPDCRRACSTSSWARARSSARPCSTAPT
jgi:hypothetical protein